VNVAPGPSTQMTRIIFLALLFACWPVTCDAQYFEGIGGSAGFRISGFSVNSRQNVTTATEGYSSLYCADLILRKTVFNDRTFLLSGINLSREQIGYYPLIKINEIPQFNTQFTDSFRVFEFRMWNYQIGIPLQFGFKLYKGWMDYFPFFWLPAINIHAGLLNNFVLAKTYNDVVLVENYFTPRAVEFFDEPVNRQVSAYYLKTIGNYNLVGQVGIDLHARFTKIDFGFNLSVNKYLTSPFNQMGISNNFSVDVKFLLMYKLHKDKTAAENVPLLWRNGL
jgi:hypothetical protein